MITLDRALGWVAAGSRMGQVIKVVRVEGDPPSGAGMGPETCSTSVSGSGSPVGQLF